MQKKIAKVRPMAMGHLMLEFEDGTKQIVHRGDHEPHQPKAGEVQRGVYVNKAMEPSRFHPSPRG